MLNLESSPHTPSPSRDSKNLLMEKGFSRTEIAKRIKEATPHLTLFSPESAPVRGTRTLPFPNLYAPELVKEMNSTIEQYDIDIFWPQNSAQFDLSRLNTEVHTAAPPDVIHLVDDKVAFNEWLGEDDPYRPLSVEAIGVEAVTDTYRQLSAEGHDVCIKPVIGVGGNGYWRLDESTHQLLNKPENLVIHPAVYATALALEEEVTGPQRMVLMDYLPGPEASIDLLTWRGEPLIHAARTKEDFATSQVISSEHDVIEHSYTIAKRLGFHGIISLQYRLDTEGSWKMLEINPRPAGGSIFSEDGGFGIISSWAKLITGEITPNDIHQFHGTTVVTKR